MILFYVLNNNKMNDIIVSQNNCLKCFKFLNKRNIKNLKIFCNECKNNTNVNDREYRAMHIVGFNVNYPTLYNLYKMYNFYRLYDPKIILSKIPYMHNINLNNIYKNAIDKASKIYIDKRLCLENKTLELYYETLYDFYYRPIRYNNELWCPFFEKVKQQLYN